MKYTRGEPVHATDAGESSMKCFHSLGSWRVRPQRRALYLALAVFVLATGFRVAVAGAYAASYDGYESTSRFTQGDHPPVHAMVKGDAAKYYAEAATITEQVRAGESFLASGERFFGPFLYPRLIAAYGLVTGTVRLDDDGAVPTGQVLGPLIAQSVLYGAALAALFAALATVVGTRLALVSALFLSLEPTLVQFSARLLTETVFVSLLMLAVAVALLLLRTRPPPKASPLRHWPLYALLGLLLGLMYLQRPGALGMAPIFAVAIFVNLGRRRLTALAASGALVAAPIVAVLLLLGLHNYTRAGLFTVASPQGSYMLYEYLGAQVVAETTGVPRGDVRQRLREEALAGARGTGVVPADAVAMGDLTEAETLSLYGLYRSEALGILSSHPLTTLGVVSYNGLVSLHLNPLGTYRRYSTIYKPEDPKLAAAQAAAYDRDWLIKIGYSALILPLAAAGWAFRRKALPMPVNALFVLSIVYFPMVSGASGSASYRYVIPNLVFYAVYWSLAAGLLTQFVTDHAWRTVRWRRPRLPGMARTQGRGLSTHR